MVRRTSDTRERVFRFVRERLVAGEPPTVREVQAAMGFGAVESARKHLEGLVASGRLVKNPGRARGYRLPGVTPDADGNQSPLDAGGVLVPLVGEVQAGNLHAAIESAEGHLVVQTRQPAEALFALRVRGDSMAGAGILEGDLVVVRRQAQADVGSIVVAMVEGEATVKRFWTDGNQVVLRPENENYRPMVFEVADPKLEILGRVVEVRRML